MEIEYEKLKGVPLVDGIKQMDLQAMLKCLDVRVKSYKRGEMIFREGDDAKFVSRWPIIWGVERSAMSAEIEKLKREGYIEVQKSHFRILKNMPL